MNKKWWDAIEWVLSVVGAMLLGVAFGIMLPKINIIPIGVPICGFILMAVSAFIIPIIKRKVALSKE